jgi:ribosome maturation protein SDO1
MVQTTARLSKQGKHFEILVDLEEALKVKKNSGGDVVRAVITQAVFYNIRSGEQASTEDLVKNFGTDDFMQVCERIIKNGEIELPEAFVKKEKDQKFKQVVEFLVKNAVSSEGRPYTPDRIMRSLEEAHVNVKSKPIDEQIGEIIEQLKRVLPIKIEVKKIRVTIPAQFTGKAYGVVKAYNVDSENWLSNGDLEATLGIPSGLVFDFFDKLNAVTHGSALSEEMK